jgi:hypothetical protein
MPATELRRLRHEQDAGRASVCPNCVTSPPVSNASLVLYELTAGVLWAVYVLTSHAVFAPADRTNSMVVHTVTSVLDMLAFVRFWTAAR